jgi:hypothetical protein
MRCCPNMAADRTPVMSTKTLAIRRDGSWAPSVSPNHGMNASASRCACSSQDSPRLRLHAAPRALRRSRRVSPCGHRAEPQDDGAPSTRPANRSARRVDVSGMAIGAKCSPRKRGLLYFSDLKVQHQFLSILPHTSRIVFNGSRSST